MSKKRSPFQIIFNTVIIGFAAFFLVFYFLSKDTIEAETKAANKKFATKIAQCGQTTHRRPVESPYIKGKLIIIGYNGSEKAWTLDDSWWGLPEELKAADPIDVGTIVRVRWSHEAYIKYSRGTSSRGVVKYALIDCNKNAIIYSGKLLGEKPDPENPISSGPLPQKEFIAFLTSLPKIPMDDTLPVSSSGTDGQKTGKDTWDTVSGKSAANPASSAMYRTLSPLTIKTPPEIKRSLFKGELLAVRFTESGVDMAKEKDLIELMFIGAAVTPKDATESVTFYQVMTQGKILTVASTYEKYKSAWVIGTLYIRMGPYSPDVMGRILRMIPPQ